MSFESLNKDELAKVADFFLKDVVAADPEKGASKKELIASLATGEDPVSWDDYKEIYLESDIKKAEDRAAKSEEDVVAAADADPDVPVSVETEEEEKEEDDAVVEDHILIKMERRNGTYETHGLRFTKSHPYKSVPSTVAESILLKEEGFRQALPSEIQSFYN